MKLHAKGNQHGKGQVKDLHRQDRPHCGGKGVVVEGISEEAGTTVSPRLFLQHHAVQQAEEEEIDKEKDYEDQHPTDKQHHADEPAGR
jgi:hypothetical protein